MIYVAIAFFVVVAAVGGYASWTQRNASENELASRLERANLGRLGRGSYLSPAGTVIPCVLWVSALLIVVRSSDPESTIKLVTAILAIGAIGALIAWVCAVLWGRPAVLVLPVARDRNVWSRLVRK